MSVVLKVERIEDGNKTPEVILIKRSQHSPKLVKAQLHIASNKM